MDASTVLTLVQTFLQVLDSPISRHIQSVWGYKSELLKLIDTISTIEDVLRAVEQQERLHLPTSISAFMLDRLKEAVYEADDLFDEIATIAQRKKLSGNNKVSQEVSLFFSRFNQFYHAFTKSCEIKNIRERLDNIAADHRHFGSMQGQVPTFEVGNHSRETHSFVCNEDLIIGRDDDKRIVIDMLVDNTVDEAVSIVSIVGIGGLGKTALAQLVYNDDQIQREFQLKMWVCVSDDFNVKALLYKVLAAATNQSNNSDQSLDQLQIKLRKELEEKKYLLVLDDMWNEDFNKWLELRKFLIQGVSGSRIFVTTRSMKVAKIIRSHQTHELEGLSDEDSWKLFERMTLEPGQLQMEEHLVEIGKEIVRKCANVPLAIRFMASLLQGKDESTWQNLKHKDLVNIKQDENDGILGVLKISYNCLPSHLKSCFTFCAVFPKDYTIGKEYLIDLWMAQGFINPSDGQSFEDLGEDYFMILLQRCFFQDVNRDDETGFITSCKMHDLVHDLAVGVAGSGTKFSSNDISSLNDKTHHLFVDGTIVGSKNAECYLTKMKRLRTCLGCRPDFICSYNWLPKMIYLRVLDLTRDLRVQNRLLKKLPSKIGQLVHLRYLDVSYNEELSLLPNSITQLCNLQTLKLSGCMSLRKLPRKLSNLVNLRHLDLSICIELRHMPPRMNRMTNLHRLTKFVVGDSHNASILGSVDVGKLSDLKYLNNLRDSISIDISKGWTCDAAEVREGGYLINKSLLHFIAICWNDDDVDDDNAEALLQGLQPHPNVKTLGLWKYLGVKFPGWGDGESLMNLSTPLPNLVELSITYCARLKYVPLLSQLRHLKSLHLEGVPELEHMESKDSSSGGGRGGAPTASGGTIQGGADESIFFPSLENLRLRSLPKLKGWWKASSDSGEGDIEIGSKNYEMLLQQQQQQQRQESSSSIVAFPRLSYLLIYRCPNLTTFPSLPNLRELRLHDSKKALRYFDSLPKESFQHLSSLIIENDDEIERLTTMEVFRSGHLSCLRSLEFEQCRKLKSITGREVWEHFTALETLELRSLDELEMEDHEGDDDMPWGWLAPSLRQLRLWGLPKMVQLPMGMRHLTALRSLGIYQCNELEEIPGWISCFTSLHHLYINYCPKVKSLPQEMRHLTSLNTLELYGCSAELKERCQKGNGADWHIIQHIPSVQFEMRESWL